MLRSHEDLIAHRESLLGDGGLPECCIHVCAGTGCRAAGSYETYDEFKRLADPAHVRVRPTGCQGFCEKGPLVIIEPHDIFYQRVLPSDTAKVLDITVGRNVALQNLLVDDPVTGETSRAKHDVRFYGKQKPVVLGKCGRIDPEEIDDYIAEGGYGALAKALTSMTPEEVIAEVKLSGLRGRGGAGFPTGVKWESGRRTAGDVKFVIANGDEGDPGAFMDRSIMEGDPHSVLEGMIICAYAVGNCRHGYIYVRQEYPLAVKHLEIAVAQARELGLLGDDILGSGFSFDVELRRGAGAFVCGESTALMFSIEGSRGMPRVTPPRSVEAGLFGKPTVLNNVETLANVPWIITEGAAWFRDMGTEDSPGTKVFALTGKVRNTGLIEVPMGITIRDVVHEIGGGVLGDRAIKAIQVGGPSGGCLTKEHLDLPLDFDSLDEVGAMMGSGGLVVMDEDDCMVDVARYFLSFTQVESCGKCPPCRIGTSQMLGILDRITQGKGQPGDIERLEAIGTQIQETSLCGLGQSAPNPVLSTLAHFREEYEAHVNDGYCPAGVCSGLGSYRIISDKCILCGLCMDACAFGAVVDGHRSYFIDNETCTACRACLQVCPVDCIEVEPAMKGAMTP
ncbi:MAG: NADH-ubiquinone oxidoreductase-F iron-sulfur binding region domain-containing protein [Coriobacteriia bacterium]|nr:NADH-ubiquinone oxidoreductase-F iron-sulfur binding region domain-containing protein [Coriobacteriia bacterium]